MSTKLTELLGRLFHRHRHEWFDAYVFDSCISITIPTGQRRVLGQAVMMACATCEATKRRPLKTWAEARLARKRIAHAQAGRAAIQDGKPSS